ncbi:DUF2213 domain-containing protein [Candidatus Pacearchaeota archaeon]|nr:DUF2213 domain-containing protein [Candidatus Pacearchaeota archaeon]
MVRITYITDSAKRYLLDKQSLPQRKVSLSDRIEIPTDKSTRIKDTKGNLTFQMDICRDGVQEYMADEIYDAAILKENGVDPDTILRVWRPPNVVFSPQSIASHDGLPLTREHPKDFIDTNNRPYLEKGINRGSFHNKNKSTISGTGFVADALMVSEIESGEYNEISDGYDSELDFKPGIVPDSIEGFDCTDASMDYDLVMAGYEPNHIAIVKEGRAGNARIHDNENKNGGKPMAGFFKKLEDKSNQKKIKDTIKKVGMGAALRMLADEEPDEEKKAALEAMAEDMEPDETEDACAETEDENVDDMANANVNLSNSETQDGDGDQSEEEIAEQARVVEAKDSLNTTLENLKKARAIIADGKARSAMDLEISDIESRLSDSAQKTTEVLDMKLSKKELAELITQTVDAAITGRLCDAGKDITLDMDPDMTDNGEPTVVEEFEVDDQYGSNMDMNDMEVSPEVLYDLAKNSQDPAVASMARALAGKLEGAAAENQAEAMESEGEDEGFVSDMQIDAPPATEEARAESASDGDAPESGTPSNQGTEAEMESMTKDGDKESEIVSEKDGYFIPKKIADSNAKVAVVMGNVLDTVNTYGLEGIDAQAHLKDGTIYHRLIDASGIGKITGFNGITPERINMAINAIRANRQKVDGMSSLTQNKLRDSSSKSGFSPLDEL